MEPATHPTLEIVRDPELRSGAPTLAGTRLAVHDIVSHVQRNDGDFQRVVDDFPDLTVEQVQAVLDWYGEHREEIDQILCRKRERYRALVARASKSAEGAESDLQQSDAAG
jgi:uncharacterized protein (DUF433 family)